MRRITEARIVEVSVGPTGWMDLIAPTTCPAHGPLSDGGGCAGCVAEDRATEAWEDRTR